MRILIVAATAMEIAPIAARFTAAPSADPKLQRYTHAGRDVDVLVTGIGMVATAVGCSRLLAHRAYELALNLGACGTFDRSIALGTVVHVVEDRIAELGAEDGDTFLTMGELRLPVDDRFVNATPPAGEALGRLPRVNGITVNTVHGHDRSIAAVVRRFNPQVESMEGAAFMSSCLAAGTPFAQVRAVSNVVEPRNRAAWKLADAIGNLSDAALRIIETV
jgi:futalosine hydrolase